MGQPFDEQISASVRAHYADGSAIWDPRDQWNCRKRAEIDRFCRRYGDLLSGAARVLNAGAGSSRYDWIPNTSVSLDKFPAQLVDMPNPVVGDLESLPFPEASFDVVICVGPVINYASAIESLSEMSRITKAGGSLLLHFESSGSLEHAMTPRWRADIALLRTLNNGQEDTLWIYSREFIWRNLKRFGFRVLTWRGFHIASAALLRTGISQSRAAPAQRLDPVLRPLQRFADDIILMAQKV
jgi:SAM-dependent methyltransferase